MSFHEVSAPPRRKNHQPHTDGLVVQRKCACGTHTGEPECEDCKKKQTIQRRDQTDSLDPLVRSAGFDLTGIDTHGPASPVTEAAPDTAAPARPATLIVDDAVPELEPGQMRKTEFLDRLRPAVCAEVELALAGTGRSTADCPYLDRWFTYYRGQSSDHVESAIQRYAPETRNARTAADYIPLVAVRARQGVERWASTGDLSGVPEGMSLGMSLGMAGGLGGLASGIGGLLFAAREGGARADDPAAVRAQLGSGRPLDSGVRSRMESAFGQSFAHVRTHTDTTGSRLSAAQNAKAFTVGAHIAFGTGEYHPGTIAGDALIAHELAHVTQQSGASTSIRANTPGTNYGALEQDADRSAAGAVANLWSGTGTGSRSPLSRARSGLRLQRCGGKPKGVTCAAQTPASATATRGSLDAPALAIIAAAEKSTPGPKERAIEVVRSIICQYFPTYADKVSEIRYEKDSDGLETGPATASKNIPRYIVVGNYFLEHTTKEDFARRVIQVRHELQHIDQLNSGMTDKNEREFVAHRAGALAEEVPGTGKMKHSVRVTGIHAALGYYYCMSPKKQEQYQAQRDELLTRRSTEVRAGGGTFLEAPTTCNPNIRTARPPEESR